MDSKNPTFSISATCRRVVLPETVTYVQQHLLLKWLRRMQGQHNNTWIVSDWFQYDCMGALDLGALDLGAAV